MPPARGTGRNLGTDTQRLPPVAADDAAALLLPDPEVVLGSVPLSAILLTSARLIALTRPEPEKLSSSAGMAATPSRVFPSTLSIRPLAPSFPDWTLPIARPPASFPTIPGFTYENGKA